MSYYDKNVAIKRVEFNKAINIFWKVEGLSDTVDKLTSNFFDFIESVRINVFKNRLTALSEIHKDSPDQEVLRWIKPVQITFSRLSESSPLSEDNRFNVESIIYKVDAYNTNDSNTLVMDNEQVILKVNYYGIKHPIQVVIDFGNIFNSSGKLIISELKDSSLAIDIYNDSFAKNGMMVNIKSYVKKAFNTIINTYNK